MATVSDGGVDGAGVAAGERSVFASRRGVSAGIAIVIALAMTGVGLVAEVVRGAKDLTGVLLGLYAAGCVLAVLAVRRRALFTAMVQPPLVLAVAVPVVVEVLGVGAQTSLRDQLLNLALPLVNAFPAMALTTAATVAVGVARIVAGRRAEARHAYDGHGTGGGYGTGGDHDPGAGYDGTPDEGAEPTSPPPAPTRRPTPGAVTAQADREGRSSRGPDGRFDADADADDEPRRSTARPRPGPAPQRDDDPAPLSAVDRYRHQASGPGATPVPPPRRNRRR